MVQTHQRFCLWALWETRSVGFPRSGGRVLSVHGSGSVHGPSSRLGHRRLTQVSKDRRHVPAPRVVGARPSGPMRGARQPRPYCGRPGLHRRGDLGPLHQASPIAQFDRAGRVLRHQHRTLGGRLMTLPRHLQVPRVVAHHPIVREDARLLELQHANKGDAIGRPPMKVLGRRRLLGEAVVVLDQIGRLQERICRRRIRDPQPP